MSQAISGLANRRLGLMRSPRARRWALGAGVVILILVILAPSAARWIIRRRLEAMVADQLNAQLHIDSLTFSFPYEVDVRGASLVSAGPGGKSVALLSVPRLDLKLARFPLRPGPLVIQSLMIDHPAIHLLRTREGLVGRRGLTKQAQTAQPKNWKLSDMFQLRRVAITGGRVTYQDLSRPRTRPLVWKGLSIDLRTAPQSGADYAFHFVAHNQPLASLDASGQANIDTLLLRVEKCVLSIDVNPAAPSSALPPEYQQDVASHDLHGTLVLDTSAVLPLMDLAHSKYRSTLKLQRARFRFSGSSDPLEKVSATLQLADGAGHPWLALESVDASDAGNLLHLAGGKLTVDPATRTWNLSRLSGTLRGPAGMRLGGGRPMQASGELAFVLDAHGPLDSTDIRKMTADLRLVPRDLSVRSIDMAQPIAQFTPATLSLRDGFVEAHQLRAAFGNDVWYVKRARVDLAALPSRLLLDDLEGCLTFGAPRARYPRAVEQYLAQAEPGGPWFFDGSASLGLLPRTAADYRFVVHTARGRLALTGHHLPLYAINTVVTATPERILVDRFEAGAFRGDVRLTGQVLLGKSPRYAFDGQARAVDLGGLARGLSAPGEKPLPLSGRANVTMHGSGAFPDHGQTADLFNAAGEFEVHQGDFWQIPVMKAIADSAQVRSAMTVSEAAGTYRISRGAVHLGHAAVSAPALGVDGSGDVRFDGRMNLSVIATVGGNWGEKIDLGDNGVASGILNKVQNSLNAATRQALYDVRIEGTPARPIVKTIPSPFLSKQATNFLGFLQSQSKPGGLLGFVRQQPRQ